MSTTKDESYIQIYWQYRERGEQALKKDIEDSFERGREDKLGTLYSQKELEKKIADARYRVRAAEKHGYDQLMQDHRKKFPYTLAAWRAAERRGKDDMNSFYLNRPRGGFFSSQLRKVYQGDTVKFGKKGWLIVGGVVVSGMVGRWMWKTSGSTAVPAVATEKATEEIITEAKPETGSEKTGPIDTPPKPSVFVSKGDKFSLAAYDATCHNIREFDKKHRRDFNKKEIEDMGNLLRQCTAFKENIKKIPEVTKILEQKEQDLKKEGWTSDDKALTYVPGFSRYRGRGQCCVPTGDYPKDIKDQLEEFGKKTEDGNFYFRKVNYQPKVLSQFGEFCQNLHVRKIKEAIDRQYRKDLEKVKKLPRTPTL